MSDVSYLLFRALLHLPFVLLSQGLQFVLFYPCSHSDPSYLQPQTQHCFSSHFHCSYLKLCVLWISRVCRHQKLQISSNFVHTHLWGHDSQGNLGILFPHRALALQVSLCLRETTVTVWLHLAPLFLQEVTFSITYNTCVTMQVCVSVCYLFVQDSPEVLVRRIHPVGLCSHSSLKTQTKSSSINRFTFRYQYYIF